MSAPRDWDAETYDRVAAPQEEWGRAVLDRVDLAGHETALDAGCGSGRVTALLLERLERGRVVGVDASPSMIEQARTRLGDRVELICCDLLELSVDAPVDLIFSTATFHWITDHEALFARLHDALVPGGRLEAQCGGEGNVARVVAALTCVVADGPFRRHLASLPPQWNFASPAETERRLAAAGFDEIHCSLEPWPVTPTEPRAFVETVILGAHADALPPDLRPALLDAVLERLGPEPVLDYVRLNISARRGPAERGPSHRAGD